MDCGEILNWMIKINANIDWSSFYSRVLEIVTSVFSISILITVWELRYTTNRLRKYVSNYQDSTEFEWHNQSEEFALMHRVRQFELLMRRVRVMQPTTPLANKRVEAVRDAVEFFHTGGVIVVGGEHLPLPNVGEFPLKPNDAIEAEVRKQILEKLRAIKWLGLEGPAEG